MSEQRIEPLTAAAIQALLDASPCISRFDLKVETVDHAAGRVTIFMPFKPEHERRAGTRQFHGGPVAAFIDIVGDFAIGMFAGGGVPTMNLRIDYLRPAVGDGLRGVGTVRRSGRTVAVVDIEVSDLEGRLCALGRGTYSSQKG